MNKANPWPRKHLDNFHQHPAAVLDHVFWITVKLEQRRCFIYRSCDLAIIQCLENQQLCSINTDKFNANYASYPLAPFSHPTWNFASTSGCKPRLLEAVKIYTHFISPMIAQFANVLFFLQELFVPLGKPMQPCVTREIVPNYSIITA